jgi:hypothetical protein
MSDHYDLLRRALKLIAKMDSKTAEDWVDDYAGLPGAELSPQDVEILRDPYRRHRKGQEHRIDALLEVGYLKKVHHVGSNGPYHSIRLAPNGHRALRLREDV